jgi:hypothetical protein
MDPLSRIEGRKRISRVPQTLLRRIVKGHHIISALSIRPESADLLRRDSIRKSPFAFLSTQMVQKGELGEEDRPL